MSRYCLDTSTYSHFNRRVPQAVELIDQAEWIGISTIVLGELGAGFIHGAHRRRNEAQLAEFLSNGVVEVLGVDSEISRHYAEIFVDLRRAGTPIPTNDVWIAATAARHGALVLTYDDHFKAVSRVGAVILRT
jgi:predicted nucleic acid-binding protein